MQVPFKKTEREIQQNFIKKMKRINRDVKQNKENEVLLYCDASHMNGIVYPHKIWQQKGKIHNKKFFCQKHQGRISVMGAIDAETHELTHVVTEGSVNKLFFSSFLDCLAERYPNKKIHLVLDNAKYQNNEEIKKKAEMLGISLIFLPPYCPNLNLIERLWKFMKKKLAQMNLFEKNSQINLLLLNFLRKFANKEFKTEVNPLFSFKFQII